jgi:membrane fusion protein (multidrug efflux system)
MRITGREMKKITKKIYKQMKLANILTAGFLAAIIMTGCSPRSDQQDPATNDSTSDSVRIEKVKIMKLEPQTISKDIEYTSTLKAYEEVHLVPSTPGRIDRIFVEVGNRFSQGNLLVQMDQTQLRQAELQLQNLETDYKRMDTLQKVGSITQQQFDQVKTQYEVAKTNVEYLKENTRLKAPFNGIVSGKYFENGEMYSAVPNTSAGKAAILSIVQINPLKAFVDIPETYFPLISAGMKAVVTCDIYPGEKYSGYLTRKYPVIDPMSHSFTVEFKVNNPGDKLRPGMFCRVNLELGEVKALVVPAMSVLKMQGTNERYVFIVKEETARRIPVSTGKRYDDLIEIISPELHEGDHLVVTGQARLIEGVPVEVVTE